MTISLINKALKLDGSGASSFLLMNMAKLYTVSCVSLVFVLVLLPASVESGFGDGEVKMQTCVVSWPCPGKTQICKQQCAQRYKDGYGFCREGYPGEQVCECTYPCPP